MDVPKYGYEWLKGKRLGQMYLFLKKLSNPEMDLNGYRTESVEGLVWINTTSSA